MPEEILFTPGQRLPDTSGGRDFGLYGAPSEPDVEVRIAERGATADDSGPGQPASSAAAAASPSETLPPEARDSDSPAGDESAAQSPAVQQLGQAQLVETSYPDVPLAASALQLGAVPDSIVALQPQALGSGAAAPAPAPAPAAAPVFSDPGAVASVAAPLPAGPEALAAVPVEPAGNIVSALAVNPIADATASTPLQVIAPIVVATADLPDALIGSVTDTVGSVTDDVQDLTGTDPAAGIGTLVGLVTAADMFDLKQADIEPVTTTVDPAMGMLDTLAGEPSAFEAAPTQDADNEESGTGSLLPNIPIDSADDAGGGVLGLG